MNNKNFGKLASVLMRVWSPVRIIFGIMLAVAAVSTIAAPFSKTISFTQPDGTVVELFGQGDEFYAVFETLDGYTAIFDHARKAYCFAQLGADGQLVSTGSEIHKFNPSTLSLSKHLRISESIRKNDVRIRRQRWEAAMRVGERWNQKKAVVAGAQASPPASTTTGTKVGLCLLIDFSDDPATIPQADVKNFCNGDNYKGYGNNGSVRQYFYDVSNGQLTYSNVVTVYIRMAQPKSFYNDVEKDCGEQGNLLIKDAIAIMKALPNYTTEILPAFESLTVNDDNEVIACNVFYAGGNGGVWSFGLWPHSWAMWIEGAQELSAGGKQIWQYQISNIGKSLELGTFCHENGHMLCDFPDIYDYDYDSVGGAGMFCLMGSGAHGPNPSQVCAYLKLAAGWGTVTDITSSSRYLAQLTAKPGPDFNHFYRFQRPGVSTEYFLIENRQAKGRDAILPASGIAVWHVDELGDRDDQSLDPNSDHANYELTLVQADNKWHFENDENDGDVNDLFYAGNSAQGYKNTFSDNTAPSARWWDGSRSGLDLRQFSASADTMTFQVGSTPENDQCAGAYLLQTNSSVIQFTTNATSLNDPIPFCGTSFGNGVWYRFSPPSSGRLILSTEGSAFDTVLALYSGGCGSLSPVLCDDDSGSNKTALINTYLPPGTSDCYILVGGNNGATGKLLINVAFTPGVAPKITNQPSSQTVYWSKTAYFTVKAAGTAPLYYQWCKNGQAIANATGTAYGITNVQSSDAGTFSVVVMNDFGTTISADAILTYGGLVNDVCSRATAIATDLFTEIMPTTLATSSGDATPACGPTCGNGIWYKYAARDNGYLTVDTIGSSYDTILAVYEGSCGSLAPVACDDDGGGNRTSRISLPVYAGTNYLILAGGYNSASGTLMFHSVFGMPPAITMQPVGRSLYAGETATVNVSASGSSPLSYSWRKNGAAIPGATTSAYTLSNAQPSDAGSYSVLITNLFGTITSTNAVFTVTNVKAMVVTAADRGWYSDSGYHDPANQNYSVGESSTAGNVRNWFVFNVPEFTNLVSGAELLINSYNNASSSTFETYVLCDVATPIPQLTAGGSGLTSIYDDLGEGAVYGGRNVYVSESNQVITIPLNAAGINALLSARGKQIAYGGYISTLNSTANNEWLFAYGGTLATDVQLRLIFGTNGPAPEIITQPVGQNIAAGATATFSVSISSGITPSFQWRRNGAEIFGATNSSLSILNVGSGDAGIYTVAVSNPFGSVISSNAMLNVVQLPAGAEFQITALRTNNARVLEHFALTGDDRGGMAISSSRLFYSGDSSTASFSLLDLSGGRAMGQIFEALVSDLRSGKMYSLANGSAPLTSAGGRVTALLEHDPASGALTGSAIALSTPIELPANNGDVGIFAGYGRVVLNSGSHLYHISLPSGYVLDLGPSPAIAHQYSENWAYWGIAENYSGGIYLVYVRDAQSIVRTSVSSGSTTILASFTNLSDMASIGVSIPYNRWYFHHEETSQFGGVAESIGYADASFNIRWLNPPLLAMSKVRCENASLKFDLAGVPGYIYELQVSTNLQQWATWRTFVLTNGNVSFSEPVSSAQSRFFRIRSVE